MARSTSSISPPMLIVVVLWLVVIFLSFSLLAPSNATTNLAKAGFKNVYSIIDGMEADANADSESVAQAAPLKDGWKNSGCPWTKKLTPERMVLPKAQ